MLPKTTIFLGSLLAFLIEPMAGRALLPHFGSGAGVWVACLCAFQVFLVAGYACGAAVAKHRRRVGPYAVLVVAAAAYTAFVSPKCIGAFGVGGTLGVVLALAAAVLPAFLLLSANATVVQSVCGGAYGLYAVSSAGSLAGLMAYALCIEPLVGVRAQWLGVAVGMAAYAGLLAAVNGRQGADDKARTTGGRVAGRQDGRWRAALWAGLPFVGCATLTSATAHLTMDIAGLPLAWAILLALYLLSWVVAFSPFCERHLTAFVVAGSVAALGAAVAAVASGAQPSDRFAWNALGVGGLLAVGLAAVHGILYASRPSGARLGVYYLLISAGGALGGVAAAILAPLCFDSVAEYPVSLLAVALCLGAWMSKRIGAGCAAANGSANGWWGYSGCAAVALVLAWGRIGDVHSADGALVHRARGFYGLMSVRERVIAASSGETAKVRTLFNGGTVHGFQVAHPSLRGKPTMYYSLNGGGIALTNHRKWKDGEPMAVGVVGLGVGTLAAYGRAGDTYRFYEISPEVIAIATNADCFSFVADSPAKVEMREGDARFTLAEDAARGVRYDVLVVDAYCGDAVPMHLATAEAFETYGEALADGGVIAIHLSNWHIDLWPVVKAAARELGMDAYGTSADAVLGEFAAATDWAFLTKGEYRPRIPTCCRIVDWSRVKDIEMPTDDRGSLLPFLRFNYAVPTL
ncbi:MAG: fused MFS/spermidine synthase [Kiritimatiellia bacterium]